MNYKRRNLAFSRHLMASCWKTVLMVIQTLTGEGPEMQKNLEVMESTHGRARRALGSDPDPVMVILVS